jgi:hypothetical protein
LVEPCTAGMAVSLDHSEGVVSHRASDATEKVTELVCVRFAANRGRERTQRKRHYVDIPSRTQQDISHDIAISANTQSNTAEHHNMHMAGLGNNPVQVYRT